MIIPTALEDIISFLKNAPIRLAVFGEFSSGKSTFLNALIGEEILSVAVEPTTAVPTYIRYAREFNIIVHQTNKEELHLFENNSAPFWTRFVGRESVLRTLERQKDGIRDFLKQWTKEGEKADLVSKITIEIPLPWLKQGIELVDTPGTNVEFTKHQQFTENVSKETDIAILLMDARHGGGKRTEFEFMNAINTAVGKCIVVLNKMDTLDEDEREDILKYVRTEALPKYWQGTILPEVFGLSALVRPGWEKEKSEPDLAKVFSSFLSTIEELSVNERGSILLKRLENPEQKLFADAQKLEKSGEYDKAHRLYFEIHDILEATNLELQPAIKGIERCEIALRDQLKSIEQANTAIVSALEKELLKPDEALTLLKNASGVFSKHIQTDSTVDAAIMRLTARIGKRDKARASIKYLLLKCRKEHEDRSLIDCCTTMASIFPLLETAELSEEELTAISAEQKRYEEERGSYIAETWNHIEMQIHEMDKTHDYSDAQNLKSILDSRKPCLNEVEVAQWNRLEKKSAQWKEYINDSIAFLGAIGKIAEQPMCNISNFYIVIDKFYTMSNSYANLLETKTANFKPIIDCEQQCLVTNEDKIKLIAYAKELIHEPAKPSIEKMAGCSFEHIENILITRKSTLEKMAFRDDYSAFKDYPDHPEFVQYLQKLVTFRAGPFTTRKKAQKISADLLSNITFYEKPDKILQKANLLTYHKSAWLMISFISTLLCGFTLLILLWPSTNNVLVNKTRALFSKGNLSTPLSSSNFISKSFSQHISTSAFRSFIDEYYDVLLRGNLTRLADFYGPVTQRYYSASNIGLREIISDQEKYISRFPKRSINIDYNSITFSSDSGYYSYIADYITTDKNDKQQKYNLKVYMKIDSAYKIQSIFEESIRTNNQNETLQQEDSIKKTIRNLFKSSVKALIINLKSKYPVNVFTLGGCDDNDGDENKIYELDTDNDGVNDVAIIIYCISYDGGMGGRNWYINIYLNKNGRIQLLKEIDPASVNNTYGNAIGKPIVANNRVEYIVYEFADDDARCCPSIQTTHYIYIKNGSIIVNSGTRMVKKDQ